jgi:hypothetical protein
VIFGHSRPWRDHFRGRLLNQIADQAGQCGARRTHPFDEYLPCSATA